METRVIVIVGPTCSGKTLVSLNLAIKLHSEIISADSRQVYKFLDIGTAKPSIEQQQKVKHHFISSVFPDQNFNANQFSNEAEKIITNILMTERIPIIVGGSGLYIKALIDGIIDEVDTDENYRNELYELRRKFGNEFLLEMLKKVDPESAKKLIPQNWKRVIRSLEVFHLTGKTIGYFQSVQKKKNKFDFLQFGLDWERNELYKNINNRVDNMIAHGLVNEVKSILMMGYDKNLNALNTVGYKEIIAFLDGEMSLDEAINRIKKNTRNYAKRQLTWFNRDKRINWIKVCDFGELNKITDQIIKCI